MSERRPHRHEHVLRGRLDSSGRFDIEHLGTGWDSGRVLQRFWREAQPVQVGAAGAQPEPDLSFALWSASAGFNGFILASVWAVVL